MVHPHSADLRALLEPEDHMHPLGCATWVEAACTLAQSAADELDRQAEQIVRLEGEVERLRGALEKAHEPAESMRG